MQHDIHAFRKRLILHFQRDALILIQLIVIVYERVISLLLDFMKNGFNLFIDTVKSDFLTLRIACKYIKHTKKDKYQPVSDI